MTLLMALLRSAYLAFLVSFTLAVSPLGQLWGGTPPEEVAAVPLPVVEKVFTAAWLAIGWIAVETAVAWTRVWFDARARRLATAALRGAPPVP
jgi:hypothetical protein